MSATNHTTNYGLSQFLGTDKPAWLVDYNGDMALIDQAIKDASDSASSAQTTANTADGKADTNASNISTLNDQINGASGIATDVTTLQGSVNTINSLIGNGTPTTTDKTLIGAINEVNARVTEFGTHLVPQDIEVSISEVTADGVKTVKQLLNDLFAGLATYIAGLAESEYVEMTHLRAYFGDFTISRDWVFTYDSVITGLSFDFNKSFVDVATPQTIINDVVVSADSSSNYCVITDVPAVTFGTDDATVPAVGSKIRLQGTKYKLI